MINMPFGQYKDFADCVRDQKSKGFSEDRASRICAVIHKKITGKFPSEMQEELQDSCVCIKCGNKVKKLPEHPCKLYVCPECNGGLE